MEKNKSSIEAVVYGLGEALSSRMPSIEKWYDDFPTPDQKLKFPCFSIFTQSPRHTAHPPHIVAQNEEGKVYYSTGKLAFSMQLDFWCENKYQRGQIMDEFIAAMTMVTPTAGLTIKLEDYYNQLVHIIFGDINFQRDSEEGVQRGEYRFLVAVNVDLDVILEKTENYIKTIETDLDIG